LGVFDLDHIWEVFEVTRGSMAAPRGPSQFRDAATVNAIRGRIARQDHEQDSQRTAVSVSAPTMAAR
jgi:hypothetical protein